MIPDLVMTSEEALSHLFLHCCFKDGAVTDGEIKAVSEKLVAAGLNRDLNFKDEVIRYKAYGNRIKDEGAYLKDLVAQIKPTNTLALYSVCIELCLSDGFLQAEEEKLLRKLATALALEETEERICSKLMLQRKMVETAKVF